MNLPKLLTGCVKALGKSDDWEQFFDLSKSGLKQSFAAIFLSLPFYYVCAASVQKERATLANLDTVSLPETIPFLIIIGMFILTFSVSAYIFCLVFDRMDRFRPWVIVRHWSIFFIAFIAAILMGLNYAGLIPFALAVYPVFGLYLMTLAVDIRLAARLAGFEWGAAVLTGCLITALGLAVILIGITQYA